MKLGLETESYHVHFQHHRMDIFDFINKAVEFGLDGVQINIIEDLNLDPEWGCLGSNKPEHLKKVKSLLDKHNLYCEIDMKGVDVERLKTVISVAEILGADVIRTYINKGNFDPSKMEKAIDNIREVEPLLKEKEISLAIENHEEEVSSEIVMLIEKINSPYVGCLCDIGNGMMAWEDPKTTVNNLAPYTKTVHFKDHIVIKDGDKLRVSGCPIGEGNIDTEYCFKTLVEKTDIKRINIEMCHPYVSDFKRPLGAGGVEWLGEGAFKIEDPYIDPNYILPMETYHPSDENLEYILDLQEKDLVKSIAYVKSLREKFC